MRPIRSAPINSRLNVVVWSPAPFGLGRNGCWPFRRSQLPRALPFIFSLCCPLNDRRRAAYSFFRVGRLFSLFVFSCPSLALLHLLILLLLLRSGGVHPSPAPIFPCSVCAGGVTWRSKSVQCCACSKWVHLRCSQLSLSQFRALVSYHSWSCPPCRITVTPSLDSSNMCASTVRSGPASAGAALSPHPRLQTFCPPSAHSVSSLSAPPPPSLAPGFSSAPPASASPLTLSGFFGGVLEVFEPGALNYFTFFRPILSTLSAFRNPVLTPPFRIPGFSALRSDRTHSRSGILSSDTTHASGGVVLIVRQGLSFSELSTTFFSSLDPYSDYVGINISINNSSSVSFLNVYAPPICSSPTDGRTDSFPPILPCSRNLFILGDFNCHHPLWDSRGTFDPRREEVFDWVISSDLLPLNDPDTPTLFHRSSGSRSSFPDIFFAPSSLAFSCSWEVLQDLGSDHLPILLSIPLSPVFHPNERPPSFNFQKARWDGFASYFDSHCPSAEEYSSLSSAAALFTSLAINAAKSSIPFGRIKRPPKAWWSVEVEEAVSERRKAFATAHRSDEDCQAYISASRRASSVIVKAKTEAWQTTCSSLSPKSNPKSIHSLLRSIAGSSSSSSFSPNFPNCSSPRESAYAACLRSHFSVYQPKALRSRARGYGTSLSSAELRALWSLTLPFALLSLPRNFLRLPPTSPRPRPLVQTKFSIPC